MHIEVKQLIKRVRKEYWHKFRFRKVLEVGSHDINGSPRKYFWFCNYTGIDLGKGKGVDITTDFTREDISDFVWFICHKLSFQVVISCEMLEHCSNWRQALKNMYNLLEDGGLMIITCAAPDRIEHGTKRTTPYASPDTTDYYRNISTEDFRSVLPESMFESYVLMYARGKNDLQFYGIKPYKK